MVNRRHYRTKYFAGASDIKSEDIIEAAKISTASEFINKHTKGFKQVLDERGEGLSGGQKQALTVARALVKKPPIFILDEPTSSMDAKTEKEVYRKFQGIQSRCYFASDYAQNITFDACR